jgi:protein SCO1/2
MIRTPVALIPYVFLVTFVLAGVLWREGDRIEKAGIANLPAPAESVAIGGPFSLVDQNGATRTEKDFAGRHTLVFFGFTHCPDVCPTTLAVIQAALEQSGAGPERITPIFITVDPERDTPDIVKSYMSAFGSRFVGLTGSPEAVKKAAAAYRVYYQKRPTEGGDYAMDHSSIIYLMGPDGRYVAHYQIETGPDGIAADLRKRLGLVPAALKADGS